MKKTIQTLWILLLSTMTLTSCSLFKSEDKKISEAMVGTFESEPDSEKENLKEKYIWEFEKNGDFTLTGKLERTVTVYPEYKTEDSYNSDEYTTPAPPEKRIKNETIVFTGKWEVKDKSITLKAENVKSDDETYGKKEKERILDDFNENFKSRELTTHDEKKIVFKDKDGDKHTLTKSKD